MEPQSWMSETLNTEDDSVKDQSLWLYETQLFYSLPKILQWNLDMSFLDVSFSRSVAQFLWYLNKSFLNYAPLISHFPVSIILFQDPPMKTKDWGFAIGVGCKFSDCDIWQYETMVNILFMLMLDMNTNVLMVRRYLANFISDIFFPKFL